MDFFEKTKNGLIVSCQALPDEPLHSSYIMGRMAIAAEEGGAAGVRANTKQDIEEIKKKTALPIIGIVKRDYERSPVFITATMREVDELAETHCEMIAMDATKRIRPNNESLKGLIAAVRGKYGNMLLMADISTVEEAAEAEKMGFDVVSTTLMGYTRESADQNIAENDFEQLKAILKAVQIPVIAEGRIDTPEKAKRCLDLGVHAVVVGSAITRPQLITKSFAEAMKNK